MKNRFRNFEKRVAALEKYLHPPRAPGLIWVETLEPAEHGLEPDQRIVKDRYFDAAGKLALTRERITRVPSDLGKRFFDGSWDSSYLDRWKPDPREPIRIVWATELDRPEVPRLRSCEEEHVGQEKCEKESGEEDGDEDDHDDDEEDDPLALLV